MSITTRSAFGSLTQLVSSTQTTDGVLPTAYPCIALVVLRPWRLDAMHAERKRDLPGMLQVVFEHVPHDPTTRVVVMLPTPLFGKRKLHVFRGPTGEPFGHEVPGDVEPLH